MQPGEVACLWCGGLGLPLMHNFVHTGARAKGSPSRLADERAEPIVMGGLEILQRRPLRDIHEAKRRLAGNRTMQFMAEIAALPRM